jgi:GNAT superfamily N-acetyltransferase
MHIQPVETSAQVDEVRQLFEEYWAAFGFTPCFQNFDAELAALPGKYAPPDGRLALAMVEGSAAGCVALRRFDAQRAEAKRLYVRPLCRGRGIGRALMEWIVAEARTAGYREIVGDSLPVMQTALNMYSRMGFECSQGASDTIYLRLPL